MKAIKNKEIRVFFGSGGGDGVSSQSPLLDVPLQHIHKLVIIQPSISHWKAVTSKRRAKLTSPWTFAYSHNIPTIFPPSNSLQGMAVLNLELLNWFYIIIRPIQFCHALQGVMGRKESALLSYVMQCNAIAIAMQCNASTQMARATLAWLFFSSSRLFNVKCLAVFIQVVVCVEFRTSQQHSSFFNFE